ncbi:MAG: o-succinylbenzoate synthase [Eggerthellaceae bacterium]|nr:o-succinylbenzoate synthase [Eggerthellaceae bacterium]
MTATILQHIEDRIAKSPQAPCFIDASAEYAQVNYVEVRRSAARLGMALEAADIRRGSVVASDMGNCPAFLYLLLAAAYAGFTVVMLNARLTAQEKAERLRSAEVALQVSGMRVLREADVLGLIQNAHAEPSQLAHWAQRGRGAFDGHARAVVMFTSGTSGRPKAAELSWANLQGAAASSNMRLNAPGEGAWQLTLPMYHVGGLEIFVRSLLNDTPFIMYRHFDATQTLCDAAVYGCTHVSVVDKMLQDMLASPRAEEVLPLYECILLGGAAPNSVTLEQAAAHGARVYTSYGMTETCSHVASRLYQQGDGLALDIMAPYQVVILSADENGYGQLGVRGPGVFKGYLNAHAAFTSDGFFITGDRARLVDGRVEVAERTGDMFVSGGENVYPEEIRKKMLQVPGVTDAFVFGVEDADWGRRPVAFAEAREMAYEPGFNAQDMADSVRISLQSRLARIYMPKHIIVLPEFPRTGIGKVNRMALRMRYNERLEAVKIDIWRVKQPLVGGGQRTARTKLRERESLIVRITDWAGRTGLGEDVAFSTDWYLPETIDDDLPVLEKAIIPVVLKYTFLHPVEVSRVLSRVPAAQKHPLAAAAVESAFWDLHGKVMGLSVRQLIGARDSVTEEGAALGVPAGCAPGGAVVGIAGERETVDAVRDALAAGYRRVKIKVKPGHIRPIIAVREEFPDLTLLADANQSFTEDDMKELKCLDALNLACIEEPLDPKHAPHVGPKGLFERLARLQRTLRTPIALDESWTNASQLDDILKEHRDLRCVVMKIGKFGGVQPALDFYKRARGMGVTVWMGGMYDTGISKRLHAAFAMLPGMNIPGDISDTSRYFEHDITEPPFVLEKGSLVVNPVGGEAGLGCGLNMEELHRVELWRRTYPNA